LQPATAAFLQRHGLARQPYGMTPPTSLIAAPALGDNEKNSKRLERGL